MSHLTREKLEALSRCWEQWEAEAATPQRKVARARLHLLFLLLRYGGLRLGEALELDARKDVDTVTGMVHVPGPNSRDVLLPLSAMRHVRRILSLPEAESMGRDFLHFDQGFIRKSFYAVAQPLGLDRAMVGPRAIRYARGLELLDLHVPVNLVQKFLGQQKPSQIAAFLNFSDGAARRMVQNKTLGPSSGTDPLCNSFLGIVEDISVGMRMASVSVRTFGDMRLGVQCSTRQFVHMEIHANQVVTVLVDPEQIVLSRSRATLSMGNCLPCTVQSIHQDQVESFVSLELGDGSRLCATVETPGLLRVGNTLLLGGLAYALVFVLAIALALLCARFEHSALDRLICRVGTTAYYVPAFWLGVLLVLVFSVNLEWLPSSGAYSYGKAGDIADRARHLVLPLAVMVASHLWYYAYMIRNKLLDEVRRDYVLLARSKGLGRTRVLWSHCLRNVMPTVVGIMAISIPHVLSGTYVAEAVFNYPGIGLLAISSAKYHDYNLLMLMVLFTGAMVIISSLLAQSINEAIDPRIKSGEVVC